MSNMMTGVTLHIDENTTHDERESFRDALLAMDGVMAAASRDDRPHLMLIEYDPCTVNARNFVDTATQNGYHAELIGL